MRVPVRFLVGLLALAACRGEDVSGTRTDGAPIDGAHLSPDSTGPDAGIDATISDAAAPDGGAEPDAGDGCAVPPTGDWVGTARRYQGGTGSGVDVRAEVRWSRVTSEGCVDRFAPAGTLSGGRYGEICQEGDCTWSRPLTADDGTLSIDRRATPARFHLAMTSPSRWITVDGAIDGALTAGHLDDEPSWELGWELRRADAAFPPPAGCSEPPAERWRGRFESDGASATVVWTGRVTEGCRDRFVPEGTMTWIGGPDFCTEVSYQPASAPVGHGDGALVIDRATDPPRFEVRGQSPWMGTRTCTHPDGTVETFTGNIYADWARFDGAYDGSWFEAAFALPERRQHRWQLVRE